MPRTRHYHVVENTPGYMPDNDPSTYATRREAEGSAASIAREYRDCGYRVAGNARDGFYRAEDPSKLYDLGRVIKIIPCDDAECLEGLE